jgi:hypothetical protein
VLREEILRTYLRENSTSDYDHTVLTNIQGMRTFDNYKTDNLFEKELKTRLFE